MPEVTPRNLLRPNRQISYSQNEESRHFKPETIFKITETLGALNTVGRYIVNMTRGVENDKKLPEEIPGALYTLSKNVLGRNVTDTIAPLVREALPGVIQQPIPTVISTTTESSGSRSCTTPDGLSGVCDDLSDCPQLLLNLSNLRNSLCFKSLFVPGVCCPRSGNEIDEPLVSSTTAAPQIYQTPKTTQWPLVQIPLTQVSSTPAPVLTTTTGLPLGNIVDPEGM